MGVEEVLQGPLLNFVFEVPNNGFQSWTSCNNSSDGAQ